MDYFDSFIVSLEDFRLTGNASIVGFDEDVIKSIEKNEEPLMTRQASTSFGHR